MSSTKWINNDTGSWVISTGYSVPVALTRAQMVEFINAVNTITSTSLVWGDVTKWLTSCSYYPIALVPDASPLLTESKYTNLQAGGVKYTGIPNSGLLPAKAIQSGFFMGQWKYPAVTSYLDYEPYTVCEIYLPFYGFIKPKIADIQGKYIQFRMYVDFQTGMAQYVVGVSANEMEVPNSPYTYGMDDTYTRIIGTYAFQLGISVSMSSTGWLEQVRNIILSTGKAVAGAVVGATMPATTTTTTQESYTITSKARNKSTGRLVTRGTHNEELSGTTETVHNNPGTGVNTAIQTAFNVASYLEYTPRGVCSNNGTLNINTSNVIKIIRRKVYTTLTADPVNNMTYRHLKGLPLGNTYQLSSLTGFTTVSNIHLEGGGFNTITHTEKQMIEVLLKGGVIL